MPSINIHPWGLRVTVGLFGIAHWLTLFYRCSYIDTLLIVMKFEKGVSFYHSHALATRHALVYMQLKLYWHPTPAFDISYLQWSAIERFYKLFLNTTALASSINTVGVLAAKMMAVWNLWALLLILLAELGKKFLVNSKTWGLEGQLDASRNSTFSNHHLRHFSPRNANDDPKCLYAHHLRNYQFLHRRREHRRRNNSSRRDHLQPRRSHRSNLHLDAHLKTRHWIW